MNNNIWFKYNSNNNKFVFEKGTNLDSVTGNNEYNQYQVYEFNSIKHLIKFGKVTTKKIDFDFLNKSYSILLHDYTPFIVNKSKFDNKKWYSYTTDFYNIDSDLINNILKLI